MRARRWEPEPLRWAGAHVIWATRTIGERNEVRSGKSSTLVGLGNRAAGFTGHLG